MNILGADYCANIFRNFRYLLHLNILLRASLISNKVPSLYGIHSAVYSIKWTSWIQKSVIDRDNCKKKENTVPH